MQRWEHFNEWLGADESLEEQTVEVFVARIIEIIDKSDELLADEALDEVRLYDMFVAIKDWLKEEVG